MELDPAELVTYSSNFIREDWASTNSLIRAIIIPLFSAGFGALAGGWFAYRLRQREGNRNSFLEELKRLQLTSLTAATLCNAGLGLKKQFIASMFENYIAQRAEVLKVYGTPTVVKTVHVKFDLMHLTCPKFNFENIAEDVRQIAGKDGGILLQLSALLGSIDNLETGIRQRNEWISHYEAMRPSISLQEATNRYLGIPVDGETVDLRHFHLMEQIYKSVDDVIFHSMHIYFRVSRLLIDRSVEYREMYRMQFNFQVIDFTKDGQEAFFPKAVDYPDWLKMPEKIEKPRLFRKKEWKDGIHLRLNAGVGNIFGDS